MLIRSVVAVLLATSCLPAFGQTGIQTPEQFDPVPKEDEPRLLDGLATLQKQVAILSQGDHDERLIDDVSIYAKGVEWCIRHNEFYKPRAGNGSTAYVKYCDAAIAEGLSRAKLLAAGKSPWFDQVGSTIRAYTSKVDGSVQPYAVSLPEGFADAERTHRWPLHVKLHGRGGTRNEVRFFAEHSGQKPVEGQNWIQLDVFGRTDNAYRWSGETDVFEAIADVRRGYRIDDRRVTLWGFSMGGAGAWHLGLHHPSKWSSVGPGAGFVDFYKYQKQTDKPRPPHQHSALHIYDSVDYTLNLYNVPFVTYGGEDDAQLVASTDMVELAKGLDVPVKLLIGPGVGHKFHPDSFKEFMAFHAEKSKAGRSGYPGATSIRFTTWTPKYNRCEWLKIAEQQKHLEQTTVEGGITKNGVVILRTKNAAALQIARDVAAEVVIDGARLPLASAADQLLPDVYYTLGDDGWKVLSYDESRAFDKNTELHKRQDLQGPIDDAFMSAFVVVTGTGDPWSEAQRDWSDFTLQRFQREFDKWLRGSVPVVKDRDLSEEDIAAKNLILFGDPGSNSVLARVLAKLPVKWTKEGMVVNGRKFDAETHGLSMIYPNPLNPQKYVVINSGHTMHELDFRASNSWLFPKLGDIAVQKFQKAGSGFDEETVWAEHFDTEWKLPLNRTASR
ncbi:MAG: prolyl oligopeptidase family serine peptidase [Planctomycetota bacterium]|nr:prolyl oligopeptidase family serine peptidase [Planctomycetota bacterium]MDA1248668.1 prolyl oligopeptidase family serine peptidase [Planctomycetota bacterium]